MANQLHPPRPATSVVGLRKSYGDRLVLDGIDLHVEAGTIFALLGPNGAGKTTTVHILSTLIGADGGELRVAGHDPATEPDAVRAAIGVTGQFAAVDSLLTGEENIRGLLLGTSIGNSAIIAAAWCVGITVVSYVWARKLYNRDPSKR
jgi:ABC-type Na+ transport system ATPase subunit NatA